MIELFFSALKYVIAGAILSIIIYGFYLLGVEIVSQGVSGGLR